jgi:hypothetical protein
VLLFVVLSLALLLALAACGTDSSGQPGGSAGGGQSSSLTLSGAVSGTISGVGTCAPASGDLFKPVWTATIGGKLYLFQLAITHYKGAATYTTDQTEGSPAVDLTSEADGTGWHSQYTAQPSTIVLKADLTSGTVDGVLTQDSGSPPATVHVSGSWACSNS